MVQLRTIKSARGGGFRDVPGTELKALRTGFVFEEAGGAVFVFNLPEKVRTFVADPSRSVSVYGPFRPGENIFPAEPSILCLEEKSFFVQALYPLPAGSALAGYILWLQIDPLAAARLLGRRGQLPSGGQFFGRAANIVPGDPPGILHATVMLSWSGSGLPVVVEFHDWTSPFPSSVPVDNPARITAYFEEQDLLLSQLSRAAAASPADARSFWKESAAALSFSSTAQHLAGSCREALSEFPAAHDCYHRAQLLDHYAALESERRCQNAISAPFRHAYPEVFEQIRRGDRLRALTVLRQAAVLEPLVGCAVLSYCLLHSGNDEEGLRACNTTLALDKKQSDVWGTKFSYLVSLARDQEALECALEHVRLYPQELSAAVNLIDALLLNEDPQRAYTAAWRYTILTENLQLALKQLFKVHEALQDLPGFAGVFEQFQPLVSGPTAETLFYYGEALTEAGRYGESLAVFERALAIEPGNGKVVLGFARLLALSDREAEAEAFLDTALADPGRVDKIQDRALLVALAAQIKRRCGRAEEALLMLNRELQPDPVSISHVVGPLPGLEYCEILWASGRTAEAKNAVTALHAGWPGHILVNELFQIITEGAAQ